MRWKLSILLASLVAIAGWAEAGSADTPQAPGTYPTVTVLSDEAGVNAKRRVRIPARCVGPAGLSAKEWPP